MLNISSVLQSFFKSKAAKNGMWLYLLQFFNTVIPILTLPYITRILGASEYGVFSIALNLIGYFMVVVEYGFHMSGSRKASLANDINELHTTFTAIVAARALLCGICFIITLLYAAFFIDSAKQQMCLLIMFLIPLGMVFQQNWLFQGLQKMQYITITSVISRLLSLVCIFLFVKKPDDLPIYCICYSITTILVGVVGTCFAIRKIHIRFVRIQLKDVMNELRSGWYVFTTSLSSKVFSAFGVTVLGWMSTSYSVGIYSAIYKIPQLGLMLWSPISQVMYPITSVRMTKSYNDGRKYVKKLQKIIIPIFGGGILIVAIFAKLAIKIAFGAEYAPYYYIVYPLLLWVLFGIINNFLGIQTLLAGGFSREYSRCFTVGVLLTVALNLILIPLFDVMGASLAPAIAEFLFGVLLLAQIKRIDKNKLSKLDNQ